MDKRLQSIEKQAGGRRNFDSPPLHLWHPPLSGDISIVIRVDGTWYHDGGRIERESLVRLFASILRREEDGDYYLVTPGEKWRIAVELHPLIVTDVSPEEQGGGELLRATRLRATRLRAILNTGKQVIIDAAHPLFLEPSVGNIAALQLDHGLTALFSRAAWYRLVDMADDATVRSGDYSFSLTP